MKRLTAIFSFILAIALAFSVAACSSEGDSPKQLDYPKNVSISSEGLITWDEVENATEYVVTVNSQAQTVTVTYYQVESIKYDFTYSVYARAEGYKDSAVVNGSFIGIGEITVGIEGSASVKSGNSITLTANVSGTADSSVTWAITSGEEYATISSTGVLKANSVDGDKIITVTATSNADRSVYASKTITIVSRPQLTQDMLDEINGQQKVSFTGYIDINLYTFNQWFDTYYDTFNTPVMTAMDGQNWYAEYYSSTAYTTMSLYVENHEDTACEVSVNLMNNEEFYPITDEAGQSISWTDAGLYNNFIDLTVNDFTFNEETWRWEYSGGDPALVEKMVASANPYEFIPANFALIVDENEILGIYSKSTPDYAIQPGYKAVMELTTVIDYGEHVEVPVIGKFNHEAIHDPLQQAITNMLALDSYKTDYFQQDSFFGSTPTYSGYTETITSDACYFEEYTVTYTGSDEERTYTGYDYGFMKVRDDLYNTFVTDEAGGYTATRAYAKDFSTAKPSFAFASEIFTYYDDSDYDSATGEGSITYYVNEAMTSVATTLYMGIDNFMALYGLYATEYASSNLWFTPFVTVEKNADGNFYITQSGFYYDLYYFAGFVMIEYSDFNSAALPDDVNITFTTREVPDSWSQLVISDNDSAETEVNALTFFTDMFGSEETALQVPFFGNVLGDTYGFGLKSLYTPSSGGASKWAVILYYDVPLDLDYTIDTSIKAVEDYLVSLGFVKNDYDEYIKGDIVVKIFDNDLDLNIYVWNKN